MENNNTSVFLGNSFKEVHIPNNQHYSIKNNDLNPVIIIEGHKRIVVHPGQEYHAIPKEDDRKEFTVVNRKTYEGLVEENRRLKEKLNRITEPQTGASPRTPNQGEEAGNQNPSQLKEATILSAKEMVHKHFAHKVTFSFGGNMTPIHGKEINANEIVAAMEEYKNQEVQLLNK